MNCQQARLLFSAYLEAELQPGTKAELEAHLMLCPDCCRLLEATRALETEWSRLPELEPPAGLVQKLYSIPETAAARKVGQKARFSGWKFWLSPAFQPVLASLTVVLVVFSLLSFTTPGRSLKKSATLELRRTYSLAQKTLVKAGVLKDKLDGYRENFMASLEAVNIKQEKK
ncbi:MAG: anti-sigma factor family protein [Candidatus Saccharicenans sp.]|uniref:anti-sigma factor family protein n=1 Tax=Candidatus Saccharicenans sp. TaxID=2819258 RepID=UPI00404A5084